MTTGSMLVGNRFSRRRDVTRWWQGCAAGVGLHTGVDGDRAGVRIGRCGALDRCMFGKRRRDLVGVPIRKIGAADKPEVTETE